MIGLFTMDIEKEIKEFFDLRSKIHFYFGYEEDWVTIPLYDKTEKYWMLIAQDTEEGKTGGTVIYSDVPFTEESIQSESEIPSVKIYTQKFLPKFIYRSEDGKATMIAVDTQSDGNKYLMIFLNSKEFKDKDLIRAYQESW